MALAGVLTSAYVVKVYWRKNLTALRHPFRRRSGDESDG